MGGTTAIRQLASPGRLTWTLARPADDAAIRRLLRENPMGGSIQLTFEREPDYFQGAGLAGAEDQTVLVSFGDRLAAVGRCIRRPCWMDGEIRSVGYLSELRLDASARGRFEILRAGYRFFQQTQRDAPADFYFTSIASDNTRARRVLESGVRGLPRYEFLGELITLLIPVPRGARASAFRTVAATADRLPELLEMLNQQARRCQLAAVWTEPMLRALAHHGLPLESFRLVFDGDRIVACGALWDQRSFRQTVVRRYARPLALVRPFLNFAAFFFGTPRLPPAGTSLAQAFLSPLALAEGCEDLLPEMLPSFFPVAAGLALEFVTLALPSGDPRLPRLQRRYRPRLWPCRLYRVLWDGLSSAPLTKAQAAFLPDLGLL